MLVKQCKISIHNVDNGRGIKIITITTVTSICNNYINCSDYSYSSSTSNGNNNSGINKGYLMLQSG